MLRVALYDFAECSYARCRYAECRGADCRRGAPATTLALAGLEPLTLG